MCHTRLKSPTSLAMVNTLSATRLPRRRSNWASAQTSNGSKTFIQAASAPNFSGASVAASEGSPPKDGHHGW